VASATFAVVAFFATVVHTAFSRLPAGRRPGGRRPRSWSAPPPRRSSSQKKRP